MGLITAIVASDSAEPSFIAKNFDSIRAVNGEDLGGLNPVHIERLHEILTGENKRIVSSYYGEPQYMASDEGPWVLALPHSFIEGLASAGTSLGSVAMRWVATEEMKADRWQAASALLVLSSARNYLRQVVESVKVPLLVISL